MRSKSRSLLCRSLFLSLAIAPVVSAQQYKLQHTNQIDLSAQFFSPDIDNNLPGSQYGTNPLSVTFDGTNAYVGGHYNSGAGTPSVGVVQVGNVLTGTTSLAGIAGSLFSTPSGRGIDAMDFHNNDLFLMHDSGSTTGFIRRLTTSGSTVWTTTAPGGQRLGAMAIDPIGNNGAPLVGYLARGSGFRQGLDPATGSLIFGSGQGAGIGANPSIGFAPRSMGFDTEGNIVWGSANGFAYGTRNGANGFLQLAPNNASSGTTASLLKTPQVDNVGNGSDILEGAGAADLLAVNARFALSSGTAPGTLTPFSGPVQNVDGRSVHLRNLDGSVTGLSQTTLFGNEDGIGSAYSEAIRNIYAAKDANNNPVLLIVSFSERKLDVYTLEPTYTGTGSGTWSDTSKWLVGLVPNSVVQNAAFGSSIASPSTITLDDARTTKNLKLDSANSYTFSGSGTLTLDGPDAWGSQIQVLNGSHTINLPVVLNKSANFTVNNSADTLNITGDISAAGKGVTKRGAGTAVVKNLRLSALALRGGTLAIAANGSAGSTSSTGALTIEGATDAWTSTLDLTNNALSVNYTGTSPIADIQNQVKSGFAGGAWTGTGIRSSTAAASTAPNKGAIAVAENSDLPAAPAVFGQVTTDADTVLVMYTLAGDATMDRKVNTLDFNILAGNFGTGTKWTQGDTNYDGAVDSQDFSALVGNFGSSLPASAPSLGSVVPEPASMGILSLGLSALALRRRK